MRAAVFVLGLLGVSGVGATPATAQIHFGVLGGFSFADFHGEGKDRVLSIRPVATRSDRTEFIGGGFVDFGLGSVFSLRPTVLFVQKGASYELSGSSLALRLNYIEIPVLFVLGIPTSSSVTLELFAGPQVAFRTSCNVDVDFPVLPDIPPTATCQEFLETRIFARSDDLSSIDAGILAGVGIRAGSFLVQGMFDYGLVDVGGESVFGGIKNRAFYLVIGWMF